MRLWLRCAALRGGQDGNCKFFAVMLLVLAVVVGRRQNSNRKRAVSLELALPTRPRRLCATGGGPALVPCPSSVGEYELRRPPTKPTGTPAQLCFPSPSFTCTYAGLAAPSPCSPPSATAAAAAAAAADSTLMETQPRWCGAAMKTIRPRPPNALLNRPRHISIQMH